MINEFIRHAQMTLYCPEMVLDKKNGMKCNYWSDGVTSCPSPISQATRQFAEYLNFYVSGVVLFV